MSFNLSDNEKSTKSKSIIKASLSSLMLVLYEEGSDSKTLPAILLDLSVNGATLVVGKPIEKDSMIKLHLELQKEKSLVVVGKVGHGKPITDARPQALQLSNYILEVAFENLSPINSKAIVSYVCDRLLAELEESEPVEGGTDSLLHRRYLRAPLTLTIFCKDKANTPFSIVTSDLSGGGVRFESPHKVTAGDFLHLQIQLDLSIPTIKAMGKIVWVRHLDNDKYEGGLAFSDISPDIRKVIVQYVAATLYQTTLGQK